MGVAINKAEHDKSESQNPSNGFASQRWSGRERFVRIFYLFVSDYKPNYFCVLYV